MEKGEVNFISLLLKLWQKKKVIFRTVACFLFLGLCVAFFSEKEYTASVTLVPHTSDSKGLGGNIGGLAAIAGIDLGAVGADSGISPSLYPKIVNSIPFQLELLQSKITVEEQEYEISYSDYYLEIYRPSILGYIKKYTIDLPSVILNSLKPEKKISEQLKTKNFLYLSLKEKKLLERIEDQVSISVNDKEGFVVITAVMPEAIAAADFVESIQKKLQNYVIDFKLKKSKEQLTFIKERYDEKEKEFNQVRTKLAKFRDFNKNISSAIAQTKLEQLKSEYDLTYNVYLELAKQYETQQIQVKEDTPVFTVLDPVSIPYERSFPKRGLVIIISVLLGFTVGIIIVAIIYAKEFLKDNLKEIV